jgi:hypothetical protein
MGSDFSLAPASAQLSVKAGASTSVVVSVTSSTNFTGSVVFSCSGLPTGITCSFSPKSVTLASGAANTTLTIAAANTVAYVSPKEGVERRLSLIFGLSIPGVFLFSNKCRRRYLCLMLPLCLLLMLTLMLGCQGVSPTQSVVGPTGTTKPPGSSGSGSNPSIVNVTITGQAGTLQHSATLSVSVQ